jgi:hypothetical protein
MKQKKPITLLAAITLISSLIFPIIFTQIALATDPTSWYMGVEGVLDTDYYSLYPYDADSLDIGLSKFGELIDSENNVGLEYAGARDPFAAPAGSGTVSKLPKNVWINGWYIALTYNHSSWGERYVWAGALFADLTDYGGPWLHVDADPETGAEDFRDSGLEIDANGDVVGTTPEWGGRKTNGTAVTEDIQVLYDGPREFIGMFENHIYDYHEASGAKLHLVDVTFTIIFNKVKKEIIVLKDVKRIDQPKYVFSPLTLDIPEDSVYEFPECLLVQFSNREEWDLGTSPEYASYVHFYTEGNSEGLDTCYNEDWTMLQTLPAGYSLSSSTLDNSALAKYGTEPKTAGTYDIAQVISDDRLYVGWAAYWPSLSDWSADAGSGRANEWWRAIKEADRHDTDSFTTPNDEPFLAPLTVGEWDFVLSPEPDTVIADVKCAPQFRGVTIYGVTDRNDGDDANRSGGSDVIDKEVTYQVEEYMNPWDLYDVVHKNTTRWVKFVNGPVSSSTSITLDPAPVQTEWDAYCTFSERVLVMPAGTLWKRGVNYSLTSSGITTISSVPAGSKLKILWSSDEWYESIDDNEFGPGRYEWGIVGRDAASVDSAGAVYVTASLKQKNMTFGLAGADMYNTVTANQMPYIMNQFGEGDTMADYMDTLGRAALNDDWCTYWPVASSNVFGVGGPLANVLSYYANDFTNAFYGLPQYSGTAYSGKITGIPCWNRDWPGTGGFNVYESSTATGYAVISTYKDINGTVIFEVWGHWGRDTYYATQWLHGDAAREINPGVLQLQEAPRGLTSIILQISYTDPKHPTFSIPELLGTISETEWVHQFTNIYNDESETETKGGIHDP